MKLRNKKTGEIIDIYKGKITLHYNQGRKTIYFKSLEDLEEWEDYEEPKEYWYYDTTKNGIEKITHLEDKEKDQEIGNYFKTKEEAEQAVEKLKAWKRLKDKGFRFNGGDDACISYILDPVKWDDELEKDFDLLFGGEE